MNLKYLTTIAVCAVAVSPAFSQQNPNQPGIGIGVGLFYPSSGQVKADVGSQFLSFGLAGTSTGLPSQGTITPEYNLIWGNGNGNKFFLLPVTVGYQYNFGINTNIHRVGNYSGTFLPYLRPFAGLAYFDYSITDFASETHYSDKQIGATYGLEGGVLISSRLKLSATYNFFTQTNGISFNGFTVSATYSFLSL